jgi:DNA (cytosine-5)-methyltransferase 1
VPDMTHVDLFSGIGGFALAAQRTGFRTVVFCERDDFCQLVLAKHWPDVPCVSDIREFDGSAYAGASLLTGGFPCQPFSCAGKRKGASDDRALWPAMFRVVQDARPCWIVGENVPGIISMELDTVLADLEGAGYTVRPIVLPACTTDAPHRRDRVWIVANRTGERIDGERRNNTREGGSRHEGEQESDTGGTQDVGNITSTGRLWRRSSQAGISWISRGTSSPLNRCNWLPEPGVGRVADGVSNRVDRLRGLGNAIVPQVAEEIMRMIMQIEAER